MRYHRDTPKDEIGDPIHFDSLLLAKALRYHLRDSDRNFTGSLEVVEASNVSAMISRRTWSDLDDDQRLTWLLEVTGGINAKTVKQTWLGGRTPPTPRNA